jgi:RNA polymerase sigma factor (sigma-70 family)
MWVAAIRRLGRDKSHLGHTAESVVQDVMCRLIKKGAIIQAANTEAYLVAAVKNLATDVLRQEARRQRDRLTGEGEADDSWKEPTAEDVAEAATDAVIRDQTRKVLKGMEEGTRQVFTERVMRNRPFTEIGQDMRISDVQARRLYRQAVREIQKKLGITLGKTEQK